MADPSEHENYEELDIYARWRDGSETFVGSIEIPEVRKDHEDMPQELEINGVVYYPQF